MPRVEKNIAHKVESGMTLKAYMNENRNGEFRTDPQFSLTGNFVSWFLHDVPYFAETVSKRLTVYRSMQSREIIGYKVYL